MNWWVQTHKFYMGFLHASGRTWMRGIRAGLEGIALRPLDVSVTYLNEKKIPEHVIHGVLWWMWMCATRKLCMCLKVIFAWTCCAFGFLHFCKSLDNRKPDLRVDSIYLSRPKVSLPRTTQHKQSVGVQHGVDYFGLNTMITYVENSHTQRFW